MDRTYGYESTAQLASFNDALSGNPDRYYDYDAAHRMTCAANASFTSCPTQTDSRLLANVGYDAADNRSTFKEYNGINDSYVLTTGTSRLDRINHASGLTDYTFDAAGRRTYDDNTSLSNDFRNYYYRADGRLRLITGKRPSTSPSYHDYQVAFAYDHEGRRIFKSDKNVSTGVVHQWWFYYDQLDRLIGVRDVPNTASPTTYNVHVMFYLEEERVGRIVLKYVNGVFNQEQRDLLHDDHLQTPVALERWPTSGASTIVWSAAYEAWGQANVNGGSTATVDLRYPGQWYDSETESRVWVNGVNTLKRPGLAQNWMREYDAWIGAYSSSDPVLAHGVAPGPHGQALMQPFTYASADPARVMDRTGLWPWPTDDVTDWWEQFQEHLSDWGEYHPPEPPPAFAAGGDELCYFVRVISATYLVGDVLCDSGDSCWVYDCGPGHTPRGWVMDQGVRPPAVVGPNGPRDQQEDPGGGSLECDPDTGLMR